MGAGGQGLDWDLGAIGNAEWSGVRLSDVLQVLATQPAGPAVERLCWPAQTTACSTCSVSRQHAITCVPLRR